MTPNPPWPAMLLGLLVLVVLLGAITGVAIKHRRWAPLVLGVNALVGVVLMSMVLLAALRPLPVAPRTVEPILLPTAIAEPGIDLGEDPEVESDEELLDAAENPAADAGAFDWIDNPPEGCRVFVTDPRATPHAARSDAAEQLAGWAWERLVERRPDIGTTPPEGWADATPEIEERMLVATRLERRATSVGTVYLVHTLARLDDEDLDWLAIRVGPTIAVASRERTHRRVAGAGLAAIAAVGVVHLALRSAVGRRAATEAH